jgi:hypothetical protein
VSDTRLAPSRLTATFLTVLSLCSLFLLSGCWVNSINGLDEGDLDHTDEDRTYDSALVGSWITNDLTCAIILDIKSERHSYHLEKTAFGEHCDDSGKTFYSEADLFQIGKYRFLDVTARPSDICKMCIAVHWIFEVQTVENSLYLLPIDSDWLRAAEKDKTVTLATVPDDPETLTALPADLKAFCRKYAEDRRVFSRVGKLSFKRK